MRRIQKILIANRGEIAVRVIRSCRLLGVPVALAVSDADQGSLAARMADEVVAIGGLKAADSYLRHDKIIAAARQVHANAIHPGYGFLSENADFAERCEDEKLIFIGPTAKAMRLMGNKLEARRQMERAGVPVIPGLMKPVASVKLAAHEAGKMGYPVMIKAAAGGGGKGIKIARSEAELVELYDRARGEARGAFGSDEVYLEKFFENAKHIEIQVFGDEHGNAVSLGERECSIQRRHQKVIEETPSPFVDDELRRRMGAVAAQAAKAIGYRNSGTLEFLVDARKNFYFLEMNTRLQVEHTVTEYCNGLDLVAEQIRVADGEPLGYGSGDIQRRGAAIQARICAEDPEHDFVPSTGVITALQTPGGAHVRFDTMLFPGLEITPYYDSLVGKLIAWGRDREEARHRLLQALRELRIGGVRTNIELCRQILADDDFIHDRVHTRWLGEWMARRPKPAADARRVAAMAAAAWTHRRTASPVVDAGGAPVESPWLSAARREQMRKL